MAEIYLITCSKNGLKYVDADTNSYVIGWYKHINESQKRDTIFHKALNNYGPDNFMVKKIAECPIDLMNELKQRYIFEHNTLYPNGYNEKIYIYNFEKMDFQNTIVHLKTFKNYFVIARDIESLPDNIFASQFSGYYVKGLKDYGNYNIVKKDFDTLQKAKEFIAKVKEYNSAKRLPFSWSIVNLSPSDIEFFIPIFIKKSMIKDKQNGFYVKYTESYDDDNEPFEIIKRFTKVNASPMTKYDAAVQFVREQIYEMNI